jgi:protein gp37
MLLEIKKLPNNKLIVYLSREPLSGMVHLKSEWLQVQAQPSLDWIIAGGESHPSKSRARVTNIEWLRAIKEQRKEAELTFFLKQLGSRPATGNQCLPLKDPKGGDMEE